MSNKYLYTALDMANRSHRPEPMAYRVTKYGDDVRLKYILNFLDLRGLAVFEPGPLEGHMSVILEKMGVRTNWAMEGRQENVDKCNRVKELYRLDRTTFIRGDLEEYAREDFGMDGPFDLVFCAGVLYHMANPAVVLKWLAKQAKTLFLATHYWDYHTPEHYPPSIFDDGIEGVWLLEDTAELASGLRPRSFWPGKGALVDMLSDAGYKRIDILGTDLQNGRPHITLLAEW